MRFAALLLVVLALPAAASAKDRPLVMLVHGGGFVSGAPQDLERQAAAMRRVAPRAKVRSVAYTLGTPTRAYEDVRAIARRHDGPVAAFGVSAGGYLAARLAAEGEVTAAVSVGGLYDLPAYARHVRMGVWGRAILGIETAEGRRSLVLRRGRDAAPNLLVHNTRDPKAPFGPARRYARRHRGVRLIRARRADHAQPRAPVRRAMRWLARRF